MQTPQVGAPMNGGAPVVPLVRFYQGVETPQGSHHVQAQLSVVLVLNQYGEYVPQLALQKQETTMMPLQALQAMQGFIR